MSPETDTELDERALLGEDEIHVHHREFGNRAIGKHRGCDGGPPGHLRGSHSDPITCVGCIEMMELERPCWCGLEWYL